MERKFKRTIEDFECEKCGTKVKGNGYTNHCPKCLWSKHVDVNPGDRKNSCQGLMEPVDAYLKGEEWIIEQKCTKCGVIFSIKAHAKDDKGEMAKIVKKKLLKN